LKKHEEILKELDTKLEKLESETEDILHKAEQGIKITKQALEQQRDMVVGQRFKKVSTEINFFKNLKPMPRPT
jgi:hypothetical protein